MGLPVCFYTTRPGVQPLYAPADAQVEAEYARLLATPALWPGHVQPRLPAEGEGDLDLLEPAVRARHGALARANGVFAFCYEQHGSTVDPVLESILADGKPDLAFMLLWRPDAESMAGGPEAWRAHFTHLLRFFHDARYVRPKGTPMLVVANAGSSATLPRRLSLWRSMAHAHGLPGLHLAALLEGAPTDALYLREFDAAVESMPLWGAAQGVSTITLEETCHLFPGEQAVTRSTGAARLHPVQYPGAFASVDVHAAEGLIRSTAVPLSAAAFETSLHERLRDAEADPLLAMPLVFVRSFNGWLEGTAIAPSLEWGTALIDAVGSATRDTESHGAAHIPAERTSGGLSEHLRPDVTLCVVRLAELLEPPQTWDCLAAALALEPGVGVIDCSPTHRHRTPLALQAHVLVVAHLDAEIIDLIAQRHARGALTLVETDTLSHVSSTADRYASSRAHLNRDLMATALRHAQATTLAHGALARTLAGWLETARTRAPEAVASLPPLPSRGISRRFVLGAAAIERKLEGCRHTPPHEQDQLSRLDAIISQTCEYAQAVWHRLTVRLALHDAPGAEAEARAWLARYPYDTRARTALAHALMLAQRNDEALRELAIAIDQNPHQVQAWLRLLRFARQLPPDRLNALAQHALLCNPSNWPLAHQIAQVIADDARPAFLRDVLGRISPTLAPDEIDEVRDAFSPLLAASGLAWPEPMTAKASSARDVTPPFGVNLIGCLDGRTGLSQGARAVAAALIAANIPCRAQSHIAVEHALERNPLSSAKSDVSYAIDIVHANPDELESLVRRRGRNVMRGRHRIGAWNWELATFPDAWTPAFAHLDEVWAPSAFTRQSIASKAPIPVVRMPYAVHIPALLPDYITRRMFGIPDDAFTFLFAFDAWSYPERKNPLAVVRAFREAFGDRRDVFLLVKMLHAHSLPHLFTEMLDAMGGAPNMGLTLTALSRDEMYALTAICDAYVSLHRAEGFGLPLAEAMRLGKPVVATAYSSNLDVMNEANSMLVGCRMIEIEKDAGPYTRGNVWADADVTHAAACMRTLADDRALAARLGSQAQADIARDYSVEAIGRSISARLREIEARLG